MGASSLQDLWRVAEALESLRGASIANVIMRSDRRQLRFECQDGTMAVIRLEDGRLEVDVVRRPAPPSSQLEVRFDTL